MLDRYDAIIPTRDLCATMIELFGRWTWGKIDEAVPLIYDGDTCPCTIFSADYDGTAAIAITEPNPTGTQYYRIFFCTWDASLERWSIDDGVDVGVISDDDPDGVNVNVLQNKTAICFSTYAGSLKEPSHNLRTVFVSNAVSQTELDENGEPKLTTVLGTFIVDNDISDTYVNNSLGGYKLYTPGYTEPINVAFTTQLSAPYTAMVPLLCSPKGISSGIFYPLMLEESDFLQIKTIVISNKTFYICGQAILIDTVAD